MSTRKKQSNCLKFRTIPTWSSSSATISTRLCTIPSELHSCASTWIRALMLSTFSERGSSKGCIGNRTRLRRWSFLWSRHWVISSQLVFVTETWNLPTCSWSRQPVKLNLLISVRVKTILRIRMMVVLALWLPSEGHHSTYRQFFGKPMLKTVATLAMWFIISSNRMFTRSV